MNTQKTALIVWPGAPTGSGEAEALAGQLPWWHLDCAQPGISGLLRARAGRSYPREVLTGSKLVGGGSAYGYR